MKTTKLGKRVLTISLVGVIVTSGISLSHSVTQKNSRIAELEGELQQNPNDMKILHKLGFLYYLSSVYDKALEMYNKALVVASGDEEWQSLLYRRLAQVYAELGDEKQFFVSIEKAITRDPSSVKSTGRRVVDFYKKREVFKERLANAERELGDGKDNTVLHCFLACAYEYELGDFNKAIAVWEKLIILQPTIPEHYLNLAQLYGKINNYDKAIELSNRLVEIAPQNSKDAHKAYKYLAYLYKQKGMIEESVAAAQKAAEISPGCCPAKSSESGLLLEKDESASIEEKVVSAKDKLRLFHLAISLYYQDHSSKPPESLGVLVPTYISKLYEDSFNPGQPYFYEKGEDSWVLWSVGPDGDNDNHKIHYNPKKGEKSDGDIILYSSGARTNLNK